MAPLLLLLLLLLSSSSPLANADQPWTEAVPLLALKAACKDPRGFLVDWSTSSQQTHCSWTHVGCNTNGFVVRLSLSGLLLGGILASAIADLSQLQILELSNNDLTGFIPESITHLQSLQSLDLSFNQFQGSIPDQLGNQLPNLQHLELRHNSFIGNIPKGLSQAASLRYLLLEGNNLSGEIPPGIGLLPHLKYLAVENNSLTGTIPADFVNLTGIVALYAGWNQLNGEIPEQIGNLRKLVYLQLQGNHLEGPIPPSLGSLGDLQELFLYSNNLSGNIPPELAQLKSLKRLDLSGNNLSGSIPANLSSISQNGFNSSVQELNLARNKLQGPIPHEIGNLSSLVTLFLQYNNLSGSIPSSLGNLSSLQSLDLSYNNLTGEVPTNGVLSKFSAISFIGNPELCGAPLNNSLCTYPKSSPPSSSGHPPPPRQTSRQPSSHNSHRKTDIIIGAVVGGVVLSMLLVLLVFFTSRRKQTVQIQNRFSPDLTENARKAKLQMFVRNFRYVYEEIVSHAGYYDTAHVLGKGRFATVYRSRLPDGTQLAVKVFRNPMVQATFEREIEMLETIKHRNLFPIRGYYSNPAENVIFYDFMPKGTLYDLLHGNDKNSESITLPEWPIRHSIALGTAKAITYLHRGCNLRILHKDLKSTNILLDEAMVPYVSDYGLAGLLSGKSPVIETPGYTPPELRSTKRYSEKSDVYSFGVVLLELLTGKKPVSLIGDRALTLVCWVVRLHEDGRGKEVLDAKLVETCPFPDCLDKALKLAILCLNEHPAQRPTMSEVASIIENLGGNPSPTRSPGVRADKPLLL